VDCYRARFITRGFSRTYGVDFDKMYAHVVKIYFNMTFAGICSNIGSGDSPNVHQKCFFEWRTPKGSLHDVTRRI
jgi:hypothetical protein